MSIVSLARPEIQTLSAYEAAAQVEDTVRLNANESPQQSPIGQFRRPLNRYPEVRPRWLQDALAERFGSDSEQLLVTRGSSEAIDLVIRTFCRAGVDNIVIPTPTFSMYKHYADVQGAAAIEVESQAERDFYVDIDAMLDACNQNTRVVVVCSPNNPTGTPVPRDELIRLLDARQDRSAVVVDEAYIEFGTETSMIEELTRYPNLLVLRTLSKALGFAGARCGAVAGSPDVIRMLNAVQAPYALATPVVECVEDVLQSDQLLAAEKAISTIVTERERLIEAVSKYAFVEKVWPSQANFFLVKVSDADAVIARCKDHKVLLRQLAGVLNNCIRISIGNSDDNNRFLAALDSIEVD